MRFISLLVLVIMAPDEATKVFADERSDSTDYCASKFNCDGKENYFCKHNKELEKIEKEVSPQGEAECPEVKAMITPEERGELLAMINDFRNKVANGTGELPKGADIRQLTWDFKLERFARIYGQNIDHSFVTLLASTRWLRICAKTAELSEVGGALWDAELLKPTIGDAVTQWTIVKPATEDIASFVVPQEPPIGPPAVRSNSSSRTGGVDKYTWILLAWGSASKIGCAFSEKTCKITFLGNTITSTQFGLCCFMGGGVMTGGKPVYKEGAACSACPAGTSCKPSSKWGKLCAQKDDPTAPEDVADLASSQNPGTFTIFLLFVTIIYS